MAYPQKTFSQTTIHPGSLIGRRRDTVSSNTLLYQLDVLKQTGRYDAFKLKWHSSYNDPPNVWPIPNHLFWDSDVAKWIEGACYILKQQSNDEVDAAIRELVEMVRSAQQPDGYLNIHFTVVEPGRRWTNLRDMHELYNAGHLIEAALAHQDLYRNDQLLEPILRYVDLIYSKFGRGPNQIPGYPGHPEIELALLRLYDHTGNPKHLDLAKFFLTERGSPKGWYGRHYYDVEAERRFDDPNKRPAFYPERRCLWYHQAHEPIEEQQTIEGHSVRAVYLLTAAADLVRVNDECISKKFRSAVFRLWDNMIDCKMYSTGGIGAIKQWEGFGLDYFLPQGTDEGGCYSETCAAIGVMMFADRLIQIDLDGRYADTMELCLYNTVLTSMSHDGKRFTYVNQLASSNQDLSQREEWFTCACCPPNVLRLLGQIGGYIWNYNSDAETRSAEIIVHLYVPSTLEFDVAGESIYLTQESDWPWSGEVKFSLETKLRNVRIKLRIPGWAENFTISGCDPLPRPKSGYVELSPEWLSSNFKFTLSIDIETRLIASHPLTNQNTISLARGPVIYCVEDVDNTWVQDHFKTVALDTNCEIVERSIRDCQSGDRFVGLTATKGAYNLDLLRVQATPTTTATALESVLQQSDAIGELKFIPYYFRANRGGRGHMRVSLKAKSPSAGG